MATSVSCIGSDEDRTRFFRLSLIIIDELTQILRDLLHNEISPAQIYNKVVQRNYFPKLRPEQVVVIHNANSRDYKDFDITLLYTLLRNVCQNITPPSQRWGGSNMPSPNEVTVGDDIERIRLIRNKIFGHISEAAISETEFKEHWSIMSGICTRIQTLLNKDYVKRLQAVDERSIDPDTEEKYLQLLKRQVEEEKSTKVILQNLQSSLTELTSKETIKIASRVAEKAPTIQTLIETSISILNEMMGAVNEVTPESDIQQIYESLIEFIQVYKEEPENVHLQRLLNTLKEKITSYAKLQGPNRIRILANFYKFSLQMRKEYGAQVECFRSSILLLLTFSCREGFDLYKNDLENGRIGEQILELFLYPTFLESFGLKADDIEISLNGRLLTRHKELTSKETVKVVSKVAVKRKFVETLSDTSIPMLNEMVGSIDEMTSESEIDELYELLQDFVQANKEEIENVKLLNLFTKLREKITLYANLQKENRMQILARFVRFNIMFKKKYGAHVDYSKSSILLLVTFSSKLGYDLYKKDVENGRIGEQILEVFLYPPFLESFGLKADDIEISLNGRLLTRHKGKEAVKHLLILIFCM
uniref:Uncharacterized protein LOC111122284 n=1 Tax=Crassostrea virginica TaxID=6565 RepID=A0A8B8CV05_CRAVI|nr:uncharacterized protein LOC111122284 [Crassostrea virginica]XP_022319644.1 uncharacterized protein LOC111122284 [Crassostrea virginica]